MCICFNKITNRRKKNPSQKCAYEKLILCLVFFFLCYLFCMCYFETFSTFVNASFLTNSHRFSACSFPPKHTIILLFSFMLGHWNTIFFLFFYTNKCKLRCILTVFFPCAMVFTHFFSSFFFDKTMTHFFFSNCPLETIVMKKGRSTASKTTVKRQ